MDHYAVHRILLAPASVYIRVHPWLKIFSLTICFCFPLSAFLLLPVPLGILVHPLVLRCIIQ